VRQAALLHFAAGSGENGCHATVEGVDVFDAEYAWTYKKKKKKLVTDGIKYKGDTRTHAQGTDPKVALGA